MEKYLGRKPKRRDGAAGGGDGDDDAGPAADDAASVESELQGRGGALRSSKIPGPLKARAPWLRTPSPLHVCADRLVRLG